MNDSTCERWKSFLDADDSMRQEITEHLAGCSDCRAILEAESEWESALRHHAVSLSADFQWSPDPPLERSVMREAKQNQFSKWIYIAFAVSVLSAALIGVRWLSMSGSSDIESVAVSPPKSINEMVKTSDKKTVTTIEDSIPNRKSVVLKTVELRRIHSDSHLPVKENTIDDGLTFVMLYPRVFNKNSPKEVCLNSFLETEEKNDEN